MDLARTSPEYLKELTAHHVGGKLKVAPEHVDEGVLNKMRKPKNNDFEYFTEVFNEESQRVGKKQFIVPYFIASHPGSDVNAMIELALFLKRNGYKTRCRAGLHSGTLGCGDHHVLHRNRSLHQEAGVYRQGDEGAQDAASAHAVLQARKLFRSS